MFHWTGEGVLFMVSRRGSTLGATIIDIPPAFPTHADRSEIDPCLCVFFRQPLSPPITPVNDNAKTVFMFIASSEVESSYHLRFLNNNQRRLTPMAAKISGSGWLFTHDV